MVLTKKEIGKRGEDIAAEFLQRKGFSVVGRNYHSRWGELDLIAVKKEEGSLSDEMHFNNVHQEMQENFSFCCETNVRFVEVKTRTGTMYGSPGEAVSFVKQKKIRKTALVWLQEQEEYYPSISFDVIEVWVVDRMARIRWLQNCF